MATFEVVLSGGATYQVDGLPDNASQDDVFAELARSLPENDRRDAQVKNDAFGNFLRNQALLPREGESEEDRNVRLGGQIPDVKFDVGTGEGALRAGFQGLTFGLGDEIVGGLKSLTSDQTFDDALAAERDKILGFRVDQPAVALGSEIAGALPTAALPFLNAPRAVQGLRLGGRIAAGSAVGGAQGAAFGFNAGEGGFESRASNAALPAALGVAGGGAIPIIAAGGRKARRPDEVSELAREHDEVWATHDTVASEVGAAPRSRTELARKQDEIRATHDIVSRSIRLDRAVVADVAASVLVDVLLPGVRQVQTVVLVVENEVVVSVVFPQGRG